MKNSYINSAAPTIPFRELAQSVPVSNIVSKQPATFTHYFRESTTPEILFVTSYPPRECGIATYSQDLINALHQKFGQSMKLSVCALETHDEKNQYSDIVSSTFNTMEPAEYQSMANKINNNSRTKVVVVQHEFGFFGLNRGDNFQQFIQQISAPVILVFHTVLPKPDAHLRVKVSNMAHSSQKIVVMTQTSRGVLETDYNISPDKIEVIAHGTHLVSNDNKSVLKEKYGFTGHTVLSTFGLLSSGKGIETTLDALPAIIRLHPDILFLIIGKTHPGVIKSEGEKYREMLMAKIASLHLENNVQFVNQYLALPVLLEYLRLTDIYLFTSKDPNQAVSGTFSYAMSCGCPIISTPIPQAREMLDAQTGIIFNFQQSDELASGVLRLLKDDNLRKIISINTLHKIAPTAWENSALAHGKLLADTMNQHFPLQHRTPEINLDHIRQMTTGFGMVQFAIFNRADISSGYTLDDNARALIAMCMHYRNTRDSADLALMNIYLNFIHFCLQPNGTFLNYVDKKKTFTAQNYEVNLEDANGRANWALGFLISNQDIIPPAMCKLAESIFTISIQKSLKMFSSRAMAFNIKGLYYFNLQYQSISAQAIITILADRLAAMYEHESEAGWNWFEGYLTYANSVLSEAMLMAWKSVRNVWYHSIALESFNFLLSKTMDHYKMTVISNKSWLKKGEVSNSFGEQPIDVAYTILALDTFYQITHDQTYLDQLHIAFHWFLGKNHLNQIMYNPCTGGCYDGLEQTQVNLNQGAESTLSYLMSRMIMEKQSEEQLPKALCSRNLTIISTDQASANHYRQVPFPGW